MGIDLGEAIFMNTNAIQETNPVFKKKISRNVLCLFKSILSSVNSKILLY